MGVLIVGDEDGLAVILELFDGVTNVSERAMIAGLLWGGEVNDACRADRGAHDRRTRRAGPSRPAATTRST